MKIKKTYQSIVPNNIVQNTLDNSTNNVYSCDYINGAILYNNASGSNDNITLSDNINNYKYIDIYFKNNDDIHSCLRTEPTNNKKIILQCINVANVYIVIKGQTRILNNNTINLSGRNYGEYSYNNGVAKYENVNNIYITKVIGYDKTTDSGISLLSLDDEDPISVHYEEE